MEEELCKECNGTGKVIVTQPVISYPSGRLVEKEFVDWCECREK